MLEQPPQHWIELALAFIPFITFLASETSIIICGSNDMILAISHALTTNEADASKDSY